MYIAQFNKIFKVNNLKLFLVISYFLNYSYKFYYFLYIIYFQLIILQF